MGRAAVPSGASTGAHEAVELRDGDTARYLGKGVLKAVDAVNGEIFDAIGGMEAEGQIHIDRTMIELDGTPNKARLGANAILGVSLAVAKAAAEASALPLYRYVGGVNAHVLPVPMMNIINGGAHADNPIDFQEFMILPVGAETFARGGAHGRRGVPHAEEGAEGRRPQHQCRRRGRLRAEPASRRRRRSTSPCRRSRRPATSRARTSALGLDCAATEFFKDGKYVYEGEGMTRDRDEQVDYLADLAAKYPIISIEDGMAEDDWDGWKALTDAIGDEVPARRRRPLRHQHASGWRDGIKRGVANSILVKVNQIGTLTRDAGRGRDGDSAPATRR